MVDQEQLARLHDDYVWKINAAVGEDRFDLVDQLADDYLTEALALMAAGEASACAKPDCDVCRLRRPPREVPPARGRRRWFRARPKP